MDTSIRPRLNSQGYRFTGQRGLVLQILNRMKGHKSAHEIYDMMRRQKLDVSLATIYRTLELLVKLNMVRRINLYNQPAVYELVDPQHKGKVQIHLICEVCHNIRDISDSQAVHLDQMLAQIQEENRFTIEPQAVTLWGICDACKEKAPVSGR